MKAMYIYILTNTNNTTLYVGVTNDIIRRVEEHRVEASNKSFSTKYNRTKLVYYEMHHDPEAAIKREKQLKAGSRAKKEALIQSMNPG